jgi:hypothetical protein
MWKYADAYYPSISLQGLSEVTKKSVSESNEIGHLLNNLKSVAGLVKLKDFCGRLER